MDQSKKGFAQQFFLLLVLGLMVVAVAFFIFSGQTSQGASVTSSLTYQNAIDACKIIHKDGPNLDNDGLPDECDPCVVFGTGKEIPADVEDKFTSSYLESSKHTDKGLVVGSSDEDGDGIADACDSSKENFGKSIKKECNAVRGQLSEESGFAIPKGDLPTSHGVTKCHIDLS